MIKIGGRRGRRGGGPAKCVCPNPDCHHEEKHVRGEPCSSKRCPECGSRMIGKWS